MSAAPTRSVCHSTLVKYARDSSPTMPNVAMVTPIVVPTAVSAARHCRVSIR